MSEKVIKEGWFRKKTYKGLGSGKRYYFVLNDLYLEWFVAPKDKWKGGIPLNQCYVRIHDGSALIVGRIKGKEYVLTYEGTNPISEAHEWYDAITKAIDNCPDTKMISNNKPLVQVTEKKAEVVQKTIQTSPQTTTTNVQSTTYQQQPTFQTTTYQQPTIQTTTYQQPTIQTTTYQQPTIQTTTYQPTFTTYAPPPMPTPHIVTTTTSPVFPPPTTTTVYTTQPTYTTTYTVGPPPPYY